MPIPPRTRFQGVAQIVRFNWTFYVAAVVVLASAGSFVSLLPFPHFARAFILAGIFVAAFWLLMSLAVAHYIYDRTAIYDGGWITRSLGDPPASWASFHAGLDEFSPMLHELFPTPETSVIDLFDAEEMTESSIQRARQFSKQPADSRPADFRALPLKEDAVQAVFLFFCAHELRHPASRTTFFRELRRVLRPNGRIVLLEHLRDWPNFFAFGPGFFHFHSRPNWIHAIESGGLRVEKEFTMTPFVRAFVLKKSIVEHV
jgi:SAM-dependent methyltransferase